MFGLFCLMPMRKLPDVLTKNTFPMYILHPIAVLFLGKVFCGYIMFPLVPIATLVLVILIRKSIPWFAGILFGGR